MSEKERSGKQNDLFSGSSYVKVLEGLKVKIRQAQQKASISVNKELVLLYWEIGRTILREQDKHGWGAKVIDRLSKDLDKSFPGVRGFSPRNLKYMRKFAEAYPDKAIVQQAAARIVATVSQQLGRCHSL